MSCQKIGLMSILKGVKVRIKLQFLSTKKNIMQEEQSVFLNGLVCKYPKYHYTTQELINQLDDSLSDDVKENIIQLGVKERYFIRPFKNYLHPSEHVVNGPDEEPISDLSAEVAKECLSKLKINPEEISGLLVASEHSDYQSPGLAPILVTKIGLSNFVPHYNIQGTACSTISKILELGKKLVTTEKDKILVVISGCNSNWYLPHLGKKEFVINPQEIPQDDPNRAKLIKKWVATMFSFLFGDGVCSFLLTRDKSSENGIKIGKITHAVNFDPEDYKKASVKLVNYGDNHKYEFELRAESDILPRSLNYSKKVFMKFLDKPPEFDEDAARVYLKGLKKIMIHTGSLKILDGFKKLYNLQDNTIKESYETLEEYGNLTGVSIPTVLGKSLEDPRFTSGKALLIGITMGFGLDLMEIEK